MLVASDTYIDLTDSILGDLFSLWDVFLSQNFTDLQQPLWFDKKENVLAKLWCIYSLMIWMIIL